jgi:hypothetical protein
MADLPSGVVTFLMTDIEASTRLWEEAPDAMRAALARHDAIAADLIAEHAGFLTKPRGEGDSTFSVYARATDAVHAVCTPCARCRPHSPRSPSLSATGSHGPAASSRYALPHRLAGLCRVLGLRPEGAAPEPANHPSDRATSSCTNGQLPLSGNRATS